MAKRKIRRNPARKWTREEDDRLLRQVRAFPQNLHKCFMLVAEDINRSDKAVAQHWYQSLSKRPEALCFFTASERHVSKNRKNGEGVKSSTSIWRKFLNLLKNI